MLWVFSNRTTPRHNAWPQGISPGPLGRAGVDGGPPLAGPDLGGDARPTPPVAAPPAPPACCSCSCCCSSCCSCCATLGSCRWISAAAACCTVRAPTWITSPSTSTRPASTSRPSASSTASVSSGMAGAFAGMSLRFTRMKPISSRGTCTFPCPVATVANACSVVSEPDTGGASRRMTRSSRGRTTGGGGGQPSAASLARCWGVNTTGRPAEGRWAATAVESVANSATAAMPGTEEIVMGPRRT